MNILYVNGHPYARSFHAAIRDSYVGGISSEHSVEVLNLGELQFDPVLRCGYSEIMPDDPDILRSQQLVVWADHIVFAYPLWWGTAPSLMTGWIARVFTPGFAYNAKSLGHIERHLQGKTGDVIITSRMPRFAWWLTGNSGAKPFTNNLFLLTGIKKRRVLTLGYMSLKQDTEERRERFLRNVAQYSAKL